MLFSGTCPTTVPAATLVANGVCEVRITASTTFTPPTGITKLAGVLVGAGGGSYSAGFFYYAGSGGAVTYVDSIPVNAPLAITVGTGGAGVDGSVDNPTVGGDTIVGANTAVGGDAATQSEIFCSDGTAFYGFGDGDGGANAAISTTETDCLPGGGATMASLSGLDTTLFPAAANDPTSYGDGGSGLAAGAVAGPDAGDGGSVDPTNHFDGADGLVILRFAADAAPPTPPISPALAATGVDLPWEVPATFLAVVFAGIAVLLASRRRRAAR
jgi:hypothetical protein